MKIIFIDKPLQDENTISPQLIDGEVFHWCVRSECLKANETFKEWLVRKEERINRHPNYSSIEGLLIYDMQPIVSIPYEGVTRGGLIVRYAFLRKKDQNI